MFNDGPTAIVVDRIVHIGRGPISCSILCHSATANRVTVEGTVTQLRQRARGSWSHGIKAENHPSVVSFASDRQIERSSNQASYNGFQGIMNSGIIVIYFEDIFSL